MTCKDNRLWYIFLALWKCVLIFILFYMYSCDSKCAGESVTWRGMIRVYHLSVHWKSWRHCECDVWYVTCCFLCFYFIWLKNFLCRILRSCNIVGQLPAYFGDMTALKVLLVHPSFSVCLVSLYHSIGSGKTVFQGDNIFTF